jgi:hypothetical protein
VLSGNIAANLSCVGYIEWVYYYSGDAITLSDPEDDSSSKSILGKSGIKTTQEVSVTYERNVDAERGLDGALVVSSPTSPTRRF